MSRHRVLLNTDIFSYRPKTSLLHYWRFFHLKPGFQTPAAAIGWRRDFCRRRADIRQKPTLTPPRMTTPEMRALVTGFSSWEEPSEAAGQKKAEGREELETAVWLFRFQLAHLLLIFFLWNICVGSLVPCRHRGIKKKSLSDVEIHQSPHGTYQAGNCWLAFHLKLEWN